MSETIVDASGLLCPLPVLRARKALKALPGGSSLTVLATDPSSVKDFQAFCRQTGCLLVSTETRQDGVFRYVIRKPEA
ncbi:MAG TPA: sulfurtransferase TusA family protein [Rhodospirillaceae bacterium]|nr:sulfurtransferase TusA family protein [Rhodospirillaceae bacterium]